MYSLAGSHSVYGRQGKRSVWILVAHSLKSFICMQLLIRVTCPELVESHGAKNNLT